jgi:hypothetical protein
MPCTSIEMIAWLRMPSDPDRYSALDISSAILRTCAKILLLSTASHIERAAAPLPIYSSVLGPESNERAELVND